MKRYEVSLSVSSVYSTAVDAESKEEAIAQARLELLAIGTMDIRGTFSGEPGRLAVEESYGFPTVDGEEVVEE